MITLEEMNVQDDLHPRSEQGFIGPYYWCVWRYDFWPRFHWAWTVEEDRGDASVPERFNLPSLRAAMRWSFCVTGSARIRRTSMNRALAWIKEHS